MNQLFEKKNTFFKENFPSQFLHILPICYTNLNLHQPWLGCCINTFFLGILPGIVTKRSSIVCAFTPGNIRSGLGVHPDFFCRKVALPGFRRENMGKRVITEADVVEAAEAGSKKS